MAALTQKGRPEIWFYFRDAPAKLNSEDQLKQREKVLAFKKQLHTRALTRSYPSPARFRTQFRNDLDQWLTSRATKVRPLDLTGDWTIDDGTTRSDARLMQTGDRVSGEYRLPGGAGTLDGLVKGDSLELRWDQPFNQRGGDAKLEILEDGQKMIGRWSYDPAKYNSGLSSGALWTFQKRERAG